MGILPTTSGCRRASVATWDWLLALLPLGLILVRRPVTRGVRMMQAAMLSLAADPWRASAKVTLLTSMLS